MKSRFGAVGRKGSIAPIERFFRTLKAEGTRQLLVPYRLSSFQKELEVFVEPRARYPVSPDDQLSGRVTRVTTLRSKNRHFRGRAQLPDPELEAA